MTSRCLDAILCGINVPFGTVSPARGHVTYALLTRLPLSIAASFDLHVLSTPPALVLSQDQTLRQMVSCDFRHTTFITSSSDDDPELTLIKNSLTRKGELVESTQASH